MKITNTDMKSYLTLHFSLINYEKYFNLIILLY